MVAQKACHAYILDTTMVDNQIKPHKSSSQVWHTLLWVFILSSCLIWAWTH